MSNSISNLFIKEALKTESKNFVEIINRLSEPRTIRLLHSSMGLVTEAGELLDALKKFIFYGKDLDLINIKEEIGDSQWYTAIALDEIGNSYEEIWALVIKKLQARYKGKFNKEGAISRDLEIEREVLENNINIEVVHWLGDVESTKVLCNKMNTGDKFTLNEELLTCQDCIALLKNGSDF